MLHEGYSEQDGEYWTTDTYFACYLIASGCKFKRISRKNRQLDRCRIYMDVPPGVSIAEIEMNWQGNSCTHTPAFVRLVLKVNSQLKAELKKFFYQEEHLAETEQLDLE